MSLLSHSADPKWLHGCETGSGIKSGEFIGAALAIPLHFFKPSFPSSTSPTHAVMIAQQLSCCCHAVFHSAICQVTFSWSNFRALCSAEHSLNPCFQAEPCPSLLCLSAWLGLAFPHYRAQYPHSFYSNINWVSRHPLSGFLRKILTTFNENVKACFGCWRITVRVGKGRIRSSAQNQKNIGPEQNGILYLFLCAQLLFLSMY